MKHTNTVLLACVCAFGALAGAATLRADPGPAEEPTTTTDTIAPVERDPDLVQRIIQRHRNETWRWERVMGSPLTRRKPKPAPSGQIGLFEEP